MAPGSLLVVVVTETVRKGFWAGPAAVAGHAVLEVIMATLLAVGLGQLLSYGAALGVIGLVGGLTLFWFAWATVKTARSATLDFDKTASSTGKDSHQEIPATKEHNKPAYTPRNGLLGTAVAGMVASISNPYWILWWATIGATYVASGMASHGVLGTATFLTRHLAADLAWYALISLAISTGARFFNDRVYRGILYVCSAFLFLFGAYFLKLGVTFIAGS